MSVNDGDVLKAVAEMVLADGTISQNVYYFIATFISAETDAAVMTAIQTYLEDIYDALVTQMSNTVTFNPSQIDEVQWDEEEEDWLVYRNLGVKTISSSPAGSTDPMPNQMAATMTANTLRPKSRGRKAIPGYVDSAADGGDLTTASVTALGVALAHYIADESVGASNDLSPGVIRDGVNAFLEFTSGEVNSIMGTQRRRKPGVGA